MGKLPLFHETAQGGVPAWWFTAPFIAFGYVLVTPRFLPDIVTVPDAVPQLATIVRWFVGLLLGVVILSVVRFIQSLRATDN
jgi:hypothetical protein